jgi:hypothetical protein
MQIPSNNETLVVSKTVGVINYLTKNQVALTSIAVFAGIGALASTFEIRWIGGIVSFCCLTAMIIIWYELHSRIPSNPDPTLYVFKLTIQWGFYGLALYLLAEFRLFWKTLLFLPLALYGVYQFVRYFKPRAKNIPWLVRILKIGTVKKPWQKAIADVFYVVLTISCLVFALWLSIPINILLDALSQIK